MLDLEPLAREATEHLTGYFNSQEHTDGERADGRLATTLIASYVKLEQTKRAGQAMEVSLAQLLLTGEKLGEYVKAAMPTSPLVRLLPLPTG